MTDDRNYTSLPEQSTPSNTSNDSGQLQAFSYAPTTDVGNGENKGATHCGLGRHSDGEQHLPLGRAVVTSPPPKGIPSASALTGIPILDGLVKSSRIVRDFCKREPRRAEVEMLEAHKRAPYLRILHRAVSAYIEAGEHCYEVAPGLSQGLFNTELRGVTADNFHLPFDSIAIVAPKEAQAFVKVVFVSFDPGKTFNGESSERTPTGPVLSLVGLKEIDDDVEIFNALVSLNGSDIRGAFSEFLRNARCTFTSTPIEVARDELKQVFWWTLNVCLYLTSSGVESEPRHPNGDAEIDWQKLTSEPDLMRRQRLLAKYNSKFRQRIYLGRSVERVGLTTRGPINVRTLVAGHWRNQVCGVGRQERRLTWIEPFWRGPKDAPESNPIRVLSESRFAVG